jgi:hypothetical protein
MSLGTSDRHDHDHRHDRRRHDRLQISRRNHALSRHAFLPFCRASRGASGEIRFLSCACSPCGPRRSVPCLIRPSSCGLKGISTIKDLDDSRLPHRSYRLLCVQPRGVLPSYVCPRRRDGEHGRCRISGERTRKSVLLTQELCNGESRSHLMFALFVLVIVEFVLLVVLILVRFFVVAGRL